MTKGNQPRVGLPVVVLGIAILLMVGLLFYHQVNALKAARAEMAAERAALTQTYARLQNLIHTKEQSAELSEKMRRMEKSLPGDPLENELINDIDIISAQAGVELVQVRFEEHLTQKDFMEIPLNMSFQGSYYNLFNLLAGLQNCPRAMRIEAFKIRENKRDRFALMAEITATVFYAEGVKKHARQ